MISFKDFKENLNLNIEKLNITHTGTSITDQTELQCLKQIEKTNGLLVSLLQKYKKDELKSVKLKESVKELQTEELKLRNELQELHNQNEDLKLKVDQKNSELQQKSKEMPKLMGELNELKQKKAALEEDLKSKTKDLVKQFNSYNHVLHYYKENFGCYLFLEKPDLIIFEFEKRSERDAKSQFFVKLSICDNGNTYKLIDLHPKLPCTNQLAEWLQKTNNVQALLVFIRKQFKPLMGKK